MKRGQRISVALVLILIGIVQVTPVVAVNQQGLTWALTENDRFDFVYWVNITGVYPESLLGYWECEVYFQLKYMVEIPDNVTRYSDIPRLYWDIYWPNGTEMDQSQYPGTIYVPQPFPIGNWSLISELWGGYFVDGHDTWESAYSSIFNDWSNTTTRVIYSKYDGVVQHIIETRVNMTSGKAYYHSEMDRIILSSTTSTTTLEDSVEFPVIPVLVVGLVVGGFVIRALIINKRVKAKMKR
ncbi:MAG: hypothetical protein RTU92_03425 [Candidatus Thorarchaeota archaeon]